MDRRNFLKVSGVASAALATIPLFPRRYERVPLEELEDIFEEPDPLEAGKIRLLDNDKIPVGRPQDIEWSTASGGMMHNTKAIYFENMPACSVTYAEITLAPFPNTPAWTGRLDHPAYTRAGDTVEFNVNDLTLDLGPSTTFPAGKWG